MTSRIVGGAGAETSGTFGRFGCQAGDISGPDGVGGVVREAGRPVACRGTRTAKGSGEKTRAKPKTQRATEGDYRGRETAARRREGGAARGLRGVGRGAEIRNRTGRVDGGAKPVLIIENTVVGQGALEFPRRMPHSHAFPARLCASGLRSTSFQGFCPTVC